MPTMKLQVTYIKLPYKESYLHHYQGCTEGGGKATGKSDLEILVREQETRCFDCLAELYGMLNEDDVLFGLWKRRGSAQRDAGSAVLHPARHAGPRPGLPGGGHQQEPGGAYQVWLVSTAADAQFCGTGQGR